ncbi:fumarylacetoacetate hydrolase family protein [Dactylosporangium sp. CA-092794]|uniref:fumarylacetoacetate hydrolase family protein n=1 Tax=Dactylosporangium sp. CA-092794 TaxID=3239929 RepID=UPI003D945F7A
MAEAVWDNLPKIGFGFARLDLGDGPELAAVAGSGIYPLRAIVDDAGAVADLLPGWDAVCDRVERWLAGGATAAAAVTPRADQVLAPLAAPQIFQAAANYRKHVIDLMVASPRPEHANASPAERRVFATALMDQRAASGTPTVFAGQVSSLNGAFGAVEIPPITEEADWELELAVVLGRDGYLVPRESAWDHVAGYTIANDITMRDRIYPTGDSSRGADWLACKGAPTFLPLGPIVVPARYVPDPSALTITLRLNGETMQNEAVCDMIFDIPRLIEHTSACAQLRAGDVLLTGSPAGNGAHHGRYLRPGDVMTGSITGLGTQRTPVVASTRGLR